METINETNRNRNKQRRNVLSKLNISFLRKNTHDACNLKDFRRKCGAAWRLRWPTRTKAATEKRQPTMVSGATERELVTSRLSGTTTSCDDGGGVFR